MTTATAAQLPAWLENDFISHWEAGTTSVSLLHGGIYDYVTHGWPVAEYLAGAMPRMLTGPRLVVRYSLDQGITFPVPSGDGGVIESKTARSEFLRTLGLATEVKAGGTDMASLLAGQKPPTEAQKRKGPSLPDNTIDAIRMILEFLVAAPEQGACAIIERADYLVDQSGAIKPQDKALLMLLQRAATDTELLNSGNPVFLLAPQIEDVHSDWRGVASGIHPIEVPLPAAGRRQDYIEERLAAWAAKGLPLTLEMPVAELAAMTASLYLRHIDDILQLAGKAHGVLSRKLARDRKKQLMNSEYAGVLEPFDSPVGMEAVGGLVEVRAEIERRVLGPRRTGDIKHAYRNILLMGSPGTGKTLLVGAVARTSGRTALVLKPENLRGKYVGESEAKWARVKRGILFAAPCDVFVDEVDQKFRRGEGGGEGSQVENNLFGSILEFFGDESNKALGITGWFATNRPDVLDPAFLSRMDMRAPLLPAATDAERADVIARILHQQGHPEVKADEPWLIALAARVTDWSNRDVRDAVTEARVIEDQDDLPLAAALSDALDDHLPQLQDVQGMIAAALEQCSSKRLLPPAVRARMDSQAARAQMASDVTELQTRDRRTRSIQIDKE